MSFILPNLSYDYDALEPHFDARTMEIHYTKHHNGYLKKLNEAIEDTNLEDQTISEIFANISNYDDAIRNNGGGFFNHNLFWRILTPDYKDLESGNLSDAITKYFGSFNEFKRKFSEVATNHFASGWAWLLKKRNGELMIASTANQDNPLMNIVSSIQGTPILCLDLWEHAYYLKYQNRRTDFIEAFWNVVNWKEVSELYNQ